MRIAEIFAQGGGHGHGNDCDCFEWYCDGAYRRTGYYYRRYGNYYCYNDGCGYNPRPHYGDLLGL